MARIIPAAFAAWVLIAFAAVLNGILREALLIPALGNALAQVVSIALLVGVIALIASLLVRRRWRDLPRRTLLGIGGGWALGAVLFEFALGRLVLGIPWSQLLAAYDVRTGALWPLAPLAMIVSPALAQLAFERRRRAVEINAR
jgi:hypothetical protein